MIARYACLLFCALCLAGCMTNPLRPSREEWPEIGNEFAKSLRWAGPDLAAPYFASSARMVFLAAYANDEGLQLTNVRHDAGDPGVGDQVQGVLTIEYYRTPSISVKSAQIPLAWSCIDVGVLLPCRWQITTELNRLP